MFKKLGANPSILKIYQNALNQEFLAIFKNTGYEEFKKRVIESIGNEKVIVLEYEHLKALSLFISQYEKKEVNVAHKKSTKFRERLIADYLNTLNDQKELLEIRKMKLAESFPELIKECKQPKFGQSRGDHLGENEFNKLILEDAMEQLVDCVNMKTTSEEKVKEFTRLMESVDKYVEIIKDKINIGDNLLKLVESKLE